MRSQLTTWAATALALVLTILIFETTSWDIEVQDLCYDFQEGTWRVDAQNALPKALFYTGPKGLIIALGVTLLTALASPEAWRQRLRLTWPRQKIAVALLTLATVPALVGWLKATTGVHCPWDHIRYGGKLIYLHTFEGILGPPEPGTPCGRCFPAGHASGGFALFGLCALARNRRQWWGATTTALALGGSMGLYQMLKGAHYLSHTLVTLLLALLVYQSLQALSERYGGLLTTELPSRG